jgi:hypothetical protein
MGKRRGGEGGIRRFVHVAFARVFVRHREALVRCCGMVCGVDELSTITIIFSRVSDGRSWRCTSGVTDDSLASLFTTSLPFSFDRKM